MNEIRMEKVWPEWELTGKLGTGDFADVYLARSMLEGEEVYTAVKVINMTPSAEALDSARQSGIPDDLLKTYFGKFKNDLMWELTMYRPLTGAGLAPVDAVSALDNDEDVGWQGYIRTPLYTPLEVYYEKATSGESDAVRMGAEICAALERCEKQNVVHGEIKPTNVMVADSGAFVLVDFGVRRCLEKAGAGIFSHHGAEFEAPEADGEKRYTHASDIYSVGMMMAYLAGGCMLPPEGNPDYIEGISPAVATVIKKATAADPAERYASAAEMSEDIAKLRVAKKPVRRAMAAMAAIDTAKKNGTFVSKPAPAPIKMPKQKAEPAKTTTAENKKTVITTAIIVVLVVIALCISFAVRNFVNNKPDDNVDTPPVSDGNEGDTGVPEIEGPDGGVNDVVKDPPAENPPVDEPEISDEPDTPPEEEPGETLNGDYLFPSDTKLITKADLAGKTNGEVNLIINEIYARHGKIFDNKSTQEYFESKEWYTPVTKSYGAIENKFNDTEWANVYFIIEYQKGTDKPADDTPAKPDDGNTQPETPPETETPTRPTPTNNDILFPSDTKLITEADLAGKTRSETYMLLNEIYARHGKMFDTKSIQDYFNSQVWYTPVSKSSSQAESKFNDIEKTNMYTIIDFQKAQGYRN